jgi:C4-dicarboxylate transporter, DctM subunit
MIQVTLLMLLTSLAVGLPVAAVLALTGYVLSENYAFIPMTAASGELAWSHSNDFVLIAAPMFIMMGELMHRSGVSERLFSALTPWFTRVPGQLIHTNIAASAVFAATSGSSLATAATIGTVAIPNMDKGGYSRPLFLGSIAAGGTLGILIPPSVNMIIYAVLSETSVADLYAAGFLPGILLAVLFSAVVVVAVLWNPKLAPATDFQGSLWPARIAGLKHLVPPLCLFFLVVGSIYLGIATPTEAAALGLVATVGLVGLNGALTVPVLLSAFEGTVRTTCMIMLIVIAAFFLNFVMVSIGLVEAITGALLSLGWPPLDAGGHRGFLSGPGMLHGDDLHDDRHHPDHRSGDCQTRLLAGLVGDRVRDPDRGGTDHPARGTEPVRCSSGTQNRVDCGSVQGISSVSGGHAADHHSSRQFSAAGALAANHPQPEVRPRLSRRSSDDQTGGIRHDE